MMFFAREYEGNYSLPRSLARGSIRESLELNESAWQVPGYENSVDCRTLTSAWKELQNFNIRAVTTPQRYKPLQGRFETMFIG